MSVIRLFSTNCFLAWLYSAGRIFTSLFSTAVWKRDLQIVFQTSRNQLLVQMLANLILKFKFFNIVVLVLWLGCVILFIWVHLYFSEKLEKRWLSDLFCFAGSLFSFLLDDLHSHVLSWLPVNLIAVGFLDLSILNVKVFCQLLVGEPFIFWKVKSNWELWKILAFFSLDSQ